MAGKKSKRFDVERELIGRALDPLLSVCPRRHRIVAAVHFHHRKVVRVVTQARFGAVTSAWIEALGRDKALVGPTSGANLNFAGHRRGRTLLRTKIMGHMLRHRSLRINAYPINGR